MPLNSPRLAVPLMDRWRPRWKSQCHPSDHTKHHRSPSCRGRELWDEQLKELHRELSPSVRRVDLPEASVNLVDGKDQRRHEPLRLRIEALRDGVQDHTLSAIQLRDELVAIRSDLIAAGLSRVANARPLTDAIVRSRAFGLHLAKLDIRQHSQVHLSAAVGTLRTRWYP